MCVFLFPHKTSSIEVAEWVQFVWTTVIADFYCCNKNKNRVEVHQRERTGGATTTTCVLFQHKMSWIVVAKCMQTVWTTNIHDIYC